MERIWDAGADRSRPPAGMREAPPPAELRRHVVCLWLRPTPAQAAPIVQRVLPDGCIDLIWIDDRLRVAGPDTRPVLVESLPGVTVVGARFRPGMAPPLLGLPASELRDQRLDLAGLWGRATVEPLEEALRRAEGAEERMGLLVGALAARLPDAAEPDPLVQTVVAEVTRRPRALGIARVAARLGISERHLHRRCLAAVGYGPKTLARILRLQRALALARRGRAGLAEVAVAAGYVDQAHFTRDCVSLTGLSPARLLAERRETARDTHAGRGRSADDARP